ncbi:MAG: HAMP domain-containing protein [Rhodanobacteraceae bacterium]|nr:MAG: HAMP domain-containing protein [Rhodanobacteraceae bacterium]
MSIDPLFRTRSIGTRLTLLNMVIAVAALALFAGIIYWRLSINFTTEHQHFLQSKVAELQADLNEAHGDPRALVDEIIKETAGSQLRQYQARVLTSDGQTLGETPGMDHDLPRTAFPDAASESLSAKLPLKAIGDRHYALTTVLLHSSGGTGAARVQFALDVTRDEALQTNFRYTLALAFLVLVPMLALAGRWVAAQGLAPLIRITEATRSITPADLSARLALAPPWPEELHELVGVFNAMLARLEEAFARLSRFSADIAHELRTPLGNLSGELEVCLMRPRATEDYRATIESGLDECRRLNVLIENLLFMARAEHAVQTLRCERFAAAQACAWVIEQQTPGATARGVAIALQGDTTIDADPVLFRQALANVLTNAVRHAVAGSAVHVGITSGPDGVEIRVRDDGEGIDAQHLPHVFDRFYQADAARRRGIGQGTGLGLSIVAAIIDMHRGTVRIDSTRGKGTTVIMHFPRIDLQEHPATRHRPA